MVKSTSTVTFPDYQSSEIQDVQRVQHDQWPRQDDQAAGTDPQTLTYHGGSGHAGKLFLLLKFHSSTQYF